MVEILVVAADDSARDLISAAIEPTMLTMSSMASDDIGESTEVETTPSAIVFHLTNGAAKGLEVLRRIRGVALLAKIPVVVLADDADTENLCRGSEIEVAEYVQRGAAPAELRAAIELSLAGTSRATGGISAAGVADILTASLENHPGGVLVFDADDRLVACNAVVYSLYWPIAKQLRAGLGYSEFLEALRESAVVDLRGRTPDSWRKARLEGHGKDTVAYEEHLNDGRTLFVVQYRTEGVGTSIINLDITHVTARQKGSRGREKRFRRLVEIGIALSAERNHAGLLESILLEAKSICNADGGTIYLHEKEAGPKDDKKGSPGGYLRFAIVMNDSLDIALGGTTGKKVPFDPLPLHDRHSGAPNHANVATHVALSGKTVNIADAYDVDGFDFSGTKAFDLKSGYRSTSFLTLPMKNRAGYVIGVLQLINARDHNGWNVVPFDPGRQQLIEALASQAAVAIDNKRLLDEQKVLLDSFIRLIADAIDRKSPYTGGHCKRAPMIAEMLAEAACEADDGPFKDFDLNEEEFYELHIAAWLHDCGKITTPEYVVDKATKLETIYDRIKTVKLRFEVLKREAEIDYLKALSAADADPAALEAVYKERLANIDGDFEFIAKANIGGEFLGPDKIARIEEIGALRWRGLDGEEESLLSEEEIMNLSISRGTLTNKERKIINDHVTVTIEMLEALPFPENLQRVPEYAGGHHERMNGTGYPNGLTGAEMSIPARMMAVADIFEDLTAPDRPYKRGKTLSETLRIM